MLVEIFLKFFICIVYIELLKVINLRGENHSISILSALTTTYTGREKPPSNHPQICRETDLRLSHSLEAYLKVFKPKDVKDANRFEVIFAFDPAVDLLDDPLEAARIKCHGQGVSAVHRLCQGFGAGGGGGDTGMPLPDNHRRPPQTGPPLPHSGDTPTQHPFPQCEGTQHHREKHRCLENGSLLIYSRVHREFLHYQAFKFNLMHEL